MGTSSWYSNKTGSIVEECIILGFHLENDALHVLGFLCFTPNITFIFSICSTTINWTSMTHTSPGNRSKIYVLAQIMKTASSHINACMLMSSYVYVNSKCK